MAGALGLYAGQRSGERVAVLLSFLGGPRPVIISAANLPRRLKTFAFIARGEPRLLYVTLADGRLFVQILVNSGKPRIPGDFRGN